jgi:hypothetical protein
MRKVNDRGAGEEARLFRAIRWIISEKLVLWCRAADGPVESPGTSLFVFCCRRWVVVGRCTPARLRSGRAARPDQVSPMRMQVI